MAWFRCSGGSGGELSIDTILEDGQVSTTSAYATASFEDISNYDFLFVKAHYDYNGVLKEYTTAVDVSQILIGNNLSFTIQTSEIGNISLKITKTTIQGTNYGGSWRNIYVDIKGTNFEVW